MSAQETPAKKRPGTKEKAAEQAQQAKKAQDARDKEAFKDPTLDEQIETLVPKTEAKIWIIGKPAELGGENNEWERYVQRRLGFIEMQRFFALCSRNLLKAVKEGGDSAVSELGGMFGGGDIRSMTSTLRQQDFNEAANFMSMAFALVSYVPDFLVECYALWLQVPDTQMYWFSRTISEPWDPDNDQYGLSSEDAEEMIQRFLDQNYEEIRRFFVQTVPKMFQHARALEEKHKRDHESDSESSKQSST